MPTPDTEKTKQLMDLFAVERSQRDEAWKDSFYEAVVDAALVAATPQISPGPDTFLYFHLAIPAADQNFQPVCISEILETCLENGCGIVVERNGATEWAFYYGHLWSLKQSGMFETKQHATTGNDTVIADYSHAKVLKETTTQPRSVFTSQPSNAFFPPYARRAIKKFMTERLRIIQPEMFLMNDPRNEPAQSLVFSIFKENFKDEKEYTFAVSRLRWFLPDNYGLISVENTQEWKSTFQPM
ncbi:MAG: hypothetical protein WCF77_02610 [Minisyncoccia bacterium]